MIGVFHRYNFDEFEPVLVYDGESEELWGLSDYWESSFGLVGLTEEEFAEFFSPPNFITSEVEDDPFAEEPNTERCVNNYPPRTEEIPDVPTVEPLGHGEDNEAAGHK